MAKDPRDRYQSAAEMRADIQHALQGVPVAAPRTAAYGAATTQRVGPPAAAAGMATGAMAGYDYGRGDESYPPEDRGRRWLPIVLWILGVLLVLGVVAAVAYAILGGGTSTHAVPQVDGQTLTQAEHAITQTGLKYKVVKQSSPTVPKNIVIRTSPANGNVVAAGSTVTIFASSGAKMVDVPNVRHKRVADAENLLRSKGFEVQEQTAANSTAPPNTVVRQNPSPGSSARFGSTVTIFVSPGGSLVPAVVGDNYQVALGKLGNAGFTNIANPIYVSNPQLSNGTVVAQSPHANQRVSTSTQITLTVVKNRASPKPTATPTPTPSQTATATSTPTPNG